MDKKSFSFYARRKKWCLFFFLFFMAKEICFAKQAKTQEAYFLLDGTAAKIGGTIQSIREVYLHHTLKAFLAGKSNLLELPTGKELFRAAQALAFQEMMLLEMKNLALLTKEKNKNIFWTDSQKKVISSVVKEFSLSEEQVKLAIYHIQQAEDFLKKKIELFSSTIPQAELEKYYERNKKKFFNKPFSSVQSEISATLKQERLQVRLENWIEGLKQKYNYTHYLESLRNE